MFVTTLQLCAGHFPRMPGSALLPTDRLQVAYHKHTLTVPAPTNQTPINLVFCHGTGMAKEVWVYHIRELFRITQAGGPFHLQTVLAIDAANHGDLAVLNEGKLGLKPFWNEYANDVVEVVRHEALPGATIAIGHSMGAYAVMVAAAREPGLFQLVAAFDPVITTIRDPEAAEAIAAGSAKMMQGLARVIRSEFSLAQEYETFVYTRSFYRKAPKKAMQAFVELQTRPNASGGVLLKTLAAQELLTYLTYPALVPYGMDSLAHLNVPVLHIMGTDTTWNMPDLAREYIRKTIPVCRAVEIPKGEHLVNVEMPDELVEALLDHLRWQENGIRAVVAAANVGGWSAAKRKEVFDKEYQLAFTGAETQLQRKLVSKY